MSELAPERLRAGAGRGLLLLVLSALAAWVWYADESAPFGRLSWMAYDATLQALRPEPRRDPRIVIVDIDDASLARFGRWPWPRERLAELVEAIQAEGPAALGLDILLPEAGSPEGDRRLALALAADNLVIATAFADMTAGTPEHPPTAVRQVTTYPGLLSEPLQPALGHISPLHEADGQIRRLYPRLCLTATSSPLEGCVPTLSLAMLQVFLGIPDVDTGHSGRHCVAAFCQWHDARHRVLIPYHHPSEFDYLSAAAILDGTQRHQLQDRLVLVGTSVAGLGDLVATPRSALTPGVDVHALMLAAWLDSQRWQPLPFARAWLLAGLAALGLAMLPGTGTQRTSRWQWGLLAALALLLLCMPPLLAWRGWWLDPWAWWFALPASAMLWLGWERWTLWRRHRRLFRLFGAYVPPGVLQRLGEAGGERHFAPRRRWLVVLFSDIRGFTELSERLPPDRLVELTNRIFTELTEEVHAHGGTLDKYIGDALMAFWGAPVATGNEVQQALACAEAMQRRLRRVNDWCRQQGFVPVAMNIGMEAGNVTVGNLGSRQRLAYTALGPAVNLAARLEKEAGRLGEPILLGPALAAACLGKGEPGAGPARQAGESAYTGTLVALGCISLKGFAKPLAIWKPVPSSPGAGQVTHTFNGGRSS